MDEIRDATNLVHDVLEDDANIIWGVNLSPELGDRLDVVVIATGFQSRPTTRQAATQPTATAAAGPFAAKPQQEEPRFAMGGVPKFVNRLHTVGDDKHN